MENDNPHIPTERITFILTHKEKVDLKIMCILTNRTMSDFIRSVINEKVRDLKSRKNG